MAIPEFKATNFDTIGKNAAELYAAYIDSLIQQETEKATVSELLWQIKLINDFVRQSIKEIPLDAIVAPFNGLITEYNNTLLPTPQTQPEGVTSRDLMVLFGATFFVTAAIMIGASFAPTATETAVLALRIVGGLIGALSLQFPVLWLKFKYDESTQNEATPVNLDYQFSHNMELIVVKHIVQTMIPVDEVPFEAGIFMPVRKTLLTYLSSIEFNNKALEQADKVQVDLKALSGQLKATP